MWRALSVVCSRQHTFQERAAGRFVSLRCTKAGNAFHQLTVDTEWNTSVAGAGKGMHHSGEIVVSCTIGFWEEALATA